MLEQISISLHAETVSLVDLYPAPAEVQPVLCAPVYTET